MSLDKEKLIEDLLYCIDGMLHDHNERNFGDRDQWIRHINNHWEEFIEKSEGSDNPYEYKAKENKIVSSNS